jgi:hypothetical protein
MSMRPDPDVTIAAWLREEAQEGATERLLTATRLQIESTSQRRPWWPARRFGTMTTTVRIALAAAAVAVVAVIGISALQRPGGVAAPVSTPSPTPARSVAPSSINVANPGPTRFPFNGPLASGTYVIGDPFVLNVSLTVPENWQIWSGLSRAGGAIYKDSPDPPNGKGVVVTTVDMIFKNACDNSDGLIDPGPTTNDLATALANQPQTLASPIADVTLAGYSGSYVEYVFEGPQPDCSALDRWPTPVGNRQAIKGESDKLWILDVDGVRLVIDTFFFPLVTEADHAEVEAIVNSIRIAP